MCPDLYRRRAVSRQASARDESNLLQTHPETSEAEPGDFGKAGPDARQERRATACTLSLKLWDTHIPAERKNTQSMQTGYLPAPGLQGSQGGPIF